MKTVTLLFLRRGGEILLAMKKRGLGEGKWNGAGGKAEPGETPVQAAIRETQEEIGVTAHNPVLAGRLRFYLTADPSFGHDCHIFVATSWDGEPAESEEMRPQWFPISHIPYAQMWADDVLWVPYLLAGQYFEGSATLDGDRVARHDIRVVNRVKDV